MSGFGGRFMAGTADGVRLLEPRDGRWQVARQGLDNGPVNSILAVDRAVLCGVLGWGDYCTTESAERFEPASEGMPVPQGCALAGHLSRPEVAYAGTMPGEVWLSGDGGAS